MITALLVFLALAIGAGVGVLVGRRQSMGADPRELAQLHQELADSRVAAARAEADVAVALTQRDAAVARSEEIEAGRQTMVEQFRLLSHEVAEQQRKSVDTSAQQRMHATEQLLVPVAATLKEFQARLTDVEKERVQIATEMRSQVRTVRDAGEAMRREAATLVNALRKPQVRGSWGETTLKNVARLSGMVERCDFDLQVTTQSDEGPQRPDMRVNLADGKHVFVDSKVPLSAFLDAAGSEDDAQKAQHLLQFARHIRTHVDQLSSKQYWKAAESPEFVVLFLPSEEFFSAALDQMPDLYEYAVKRDVVIATPTTLIGMLRAISYGWKQAALADKAAEVFKLGRELHERLGQMGAKFDKLGRALASSVNAYNETVGTVESRVMVSARRFRDLQVSEGDLAPIQALEAPVRQAQAEELTGRAVPSVAELVEADVEALWSDDDLRHEA
jgi:DNA recombination protein RmuC